MSVSAFNPSTFDNVDLIFSGNVLLGVTAVLIIIFVIFYCVILPFSCFLFPREQPRRSYSMEPQGFGLSACAFRFPSWDATSPNGSEINFCTNAPDFPLFPFVVCALVMVAFFVRQYELKTPYGKK